ncbi:hypothetical protein EVAR_74746_1 [Eumeta japonica]|uniref:Uncharacterized protein n=1 Tax=Eumeta variegata TaxID=151549 RepID=A0A4C1SPB0_EUMVA|nr:hypothetical protein EVAR_74746_1 [Eumeta japonica]
MGPPAARRAPRVRSRKLRATSRTSAPPLSRARAGTGSMKRNLQIGIRCKNPNILACDVKARGEKAAFKRRPSPGRAFRERPPTTLVRRRRRGAGRARGGLAYLHTPCKLRDPPANLTPVRRGDGREGASHDAIRFT